MKFKILIANSLVALFVCFSIMPFVVVLSKRLNAVSEVGYRHMSKTPVGRLGGIAGLVGMIIGILLQLTFDQSAREVFYDSISQMLGVLLGLICIGMVGFIDDLRRLSARTKFLVQLFAALIVYVSGLRLSVIDLPFLDPITIGWWSLPVTVFWIVGIVNAINLIDGLDGLAGGVILFAAIVNLVSAITTGSEIPAVLMVALSGATLGFLIYNWHPAKIYLGDCGAYSFGFILAVCGLLAPVQKASTSIGIIVPILAVGLPIFDTSLTLLRRSLNRRGLFSPDRGHLHHVLVDAGISQRKVVVGLYLGCSVLASFALLIVLKRRPEIGLLLVGASILGFLFWGFSVKSRLKNVLDRMFRSTPKAGSVDKF